MKGHKYLDEIPNRQTKHYLEYCSKKDKRQKVWQSEREEYGLDSRETWSLDSSFYIWLYEHLMMYREKAIEIIDLEAYKFKYNGKTLTQLECIDRMIEGCKLYIQDPDTADDEKRRKIKDVCKIWGLVINYMWW